MRNVCITTSLSILFTAVCFQWSCAQVYPSDFAPVLVANGISNPTVMAFAPDGRIFVAQQEGSLRVIKNNTLLATPFITLTVSSSGERGLIGIALDPDFPINNYIYLYYTVPGSPAHNRISRVTANGDVAQAGSEMIVLELDPLSSATNHNGGAMHFGKDGKLYVAIGENANTAHAQNLDTYHGKLLRINKDGSVPEGNPYPTGTEQRRRVWAHGLRNPYTFAIHPVTGRILVNDVGQNAWEEVNDATTGGGILDGLQQKGILIKPPILIIPIRFMRIPTAAATEKDVLLREVCSSIRSPPIIPQPCSVGIFSRTCATTGSTHWIFPAVLPLARLSPLRSLEMG